MKNFGSILAFIALSASVVSARVVVVPNEAGVEARSPYPQTDHGVYVREESKKGKDSGVNGTSLPRTSHLFETNL